MSKRSFFGLEPDQLDRLLSLGTEAADGADAVEPDRGPSNQGNAPQPPAEGLSVPTLDVPLEHMGSCVGPYRLISVLGEGGMGTVYLADQTAPIRRRVALKVIKPGMDSARVVARFEAERQALAVLDHANIAHVYDAGTTDSGRPYFVMEYVKGLPLPEYCDRHTLNIEARLRLFQQVCHGVQHAHQKGIIHRDIKPSNIVVTTEGDEAIPKIIDFGVAKAISQPLTERTLVTEDTHLLGTPEYMSPEQADMANEDVDTRSDIYSLGVLLYVLLTGVLPFDSETLRTGGIDHIRQVIRETDPKTPSTRLTKLGEEAQKLAESRRTEVATLAKKLHQELEWIPLKAVRKERSERYRSASELADDIENYLKGEPLIAGPPGIIYKLKKFVRRNRVLVGGIAAVLMVLVLGVVVSTVFAIRAEHARAEAQLVTDFLNNNVIGSASTIKGREATVIDVLNAAVVKLDEGQFQDRPLTEGSIRSRLAYAYYDLGQYAVAAEHQKPVYRIYLEQLGENHIKTNIALNWLAVYYYHAGRYREAEPLYRQVIEKAYRQTRGSLVEMHLWWNANLGTTCAGLGRYEEAEQLVRPKVEATPGAQYGLHLGEVYREQGRYEQAERVLIESLDADHRVEEKKKNVQFYNATGRCMHELALLRLAQGRDEDAEGLFKQGIESGTANLPGKDHPVTLRHVNGLAVIRIMQKQYQEAEALLERALAGQKLKLGENHPDTIKTIHDLGILHREQGQYDEAEKFLIEAHNKGQTTLGEDHPATLETINDLGVLCREQGQYADAESLFRQALKGRQRKLGSDHPACFESMHELGVLYLRQARWADANSLLLQAFHGRETKLGPDHPHTLGSLKQLVTLYESWGKPDEAAQWRAKLAETKAAEE